MKLWPYLKAGQKVVFSKVPSWSYLKAGDTYEIEYIEHGEIYFRDTKTGGGSFDKLRDIKNGHFTIKEIL